MSDPAPPPHQVQVFLSYGRRDASTFVDRLEADLTAASYRVWRDRSDLHAAHAWDSQLQAAIKRSSLMVAVLTPHAVRATAEEESVCLDELAVARFQAPSTPIVPLMLIACEPPFVIYRLQWVDFVGTDADEARYQSALSQLLKAMKMVVEGKRPEARNLRLEPLDFDLYLAAKTRDFVGREWLVGTVLERMTHSPWPAVVIVGEAGWGKTAFAGRLFAANPNGQMLAAHFCRADRLDTIDPRRFVNSIAAMTALRIPAYADHLAAILDANPTFTNDTEMLERLFIQPLASLEPNVRGPGARYVLIDGLDESVLPGGRSDLPRMLARACALLPDWLRLVVTTRDAFGLIEAFAAADVIRLQADDPRNQADIRRLVAERLEPCGIVPTEVARLAATIAAKAEGNVLVAAQLSAAVRSSGLNAGQVLDLPRELTGLYRALMERRIDPNGADWMAVREVMEMVLATDTALPVTLAAIARGDREGYATGTAVNKVSDLLTRQDDAIQVYHQTFREFLGQRSTPFFTNAAAGARRLASLATDSQRTAQLPPDLRRFCRSNVLSWIVRSANVTAYGDKIVSIYQDALTDRPFNAAVGATYTNAEDQDLIRMIAAAGLTDPLVEAGEAIMKQAWAAMQASGAIKWLNKTDLPPPAEGEQVPMMRTLFKSVSLTGFALEWMKLVFGAAPESGVKIRTVLKEHDKLRYVFGWFDIGIGNEALGISRAFEDYGTVIRMRWTELDEMSRSKPAPE
jgi:hypothetical protein